MIQTLIGIAVGGLITAVVAHYYFIRGRRKSLTPYFTLASNVFGGVDIEDRRKLRFEYLGTEIPDLHQVEFLIGNDGQLAISNCIEPLTLHLPTDVPLLDASIIFRSPDTLDVKVRQRDLKHESHPMVDFHFPLLNRGDFFVVKLLLGRKVTPRGCRFTILADDLPRELEPTWLPPEAAKRGRVSLEWGVMAFGLGILITGALMGYLLYMLAQHRPEAFPFPWSGLELSVLSVMVVPLSVLISLGFILLGFLMLIVLVLDPFMSRRVPFSIPEEIASRGFRYSRANLRRLRGQKMYRIVAPTKDHKEGRT